MSNLNRLLQIGFNAAEQHESVHGPLSLDVHTISQGNSVPQKEWTLNLGQGTVTLNTGSATLPILKPTILSIADAIDRMSGYEQYNLNTTAGYRALALESHEWRTMYQVKERYLSYVCGKEEVLVLVESVPCQRCGVVLPIKNITMDHQRPQKHGKIEAIAKVFRALGLTESAPRGTKGRWIQQGGLLGTAPTPTIPTKATRDVVGEKVVASRFDGAGDKDFRYTLNAPGLAFYSVVCGFDATFAHRYAAGSKPRVMLQERCMNSIINLAPLCNSCNPGAGGGINKLKYPPTSQ